MRNPPREASSTANPKISAMSLFSVDAMTSDNWRESGGYQTGDAVRYAITFVNNITNRPPRLYQSTTLVDDLRYVQKNTTNDWSIYTCGTNATVSFITRKGARRCDAIITHTGD